MAAIVIRPALSPGDIASSQEPRTGITEMATDGRNSAQTRNTSGIVLVRNLSNGSLFFDTA
jgi:hypothetical protein